MFGAVRPRWSARSRIAGRGRAAPRVWQVVAAAVAATVVASVLVAPTSFAAPPSWPAPAAPDTGRSVPVSSMSPRVASRAGSQTNPAWNAGAPAWPAGGDAAIAVDTTTAGATRTTPQTSSAGFGHAGGLGVTVHGQGADSVNERALVHGVVVASGAGTVKVSVADRATTDAAGVRGVLFTVVRADGVSGSAKVGLDLGYAGFASAYGADFGGRLRLVRLPSCVLTPPLLPQCQIQTPVPGVVNTVDGQVVSADAVDVGDGTRAVTFAARDGKAASGSKVPAAGAWGPSEAEVDKGAGGPAEARSTNGTDMVTAASMSDQPVYAMAAGASSASGTYAHTTLAPTYSWGAGSQGGEFSYSVPLALPPVSAGPKPELTLAYSSNSVDGKTTSTNNQASWVGEGWDLQTGYIERSYRACVDDGGTTGDLCWFTDKVITMVFGGKSTRLIKDDNTGVWHPESDDGSKVELLTDNTVTNGDYFFQYWKITQQDGTQYFFGKHKRYAGDPDATNSVQKVLVYGNNAGEPCYVAGQPYNSGCDRACRWNLDYVIDPAGNSMTYFYERYQGKYGNYNGANNWVYDLTSRLKRIDYGTRAGSEGASTPVARVNLTENPRCDPASSGCSSYPDVPWDQYCATTQTAPCSQYTPTYWTPWQLAMIYSEVYDQAAGAFRQVDSYYLTKTFPSPGDGTAAALWFSALQHTGKVVAGGGDVTLPPMTFGGEAKPNRVNNGTSNHYRMTLVSTGTGEEVAVTYKPTECTAATVGTYAVDQNSHLCFVGDGSWFHKYVVDKVTDRDLTGGSPDEVTSYMYSTAGSTVPALWRLDSNEAAAAHTYSDFAGYPTVTTKRGPAGGQQTVTERLYFRSLAGDQLLNGTQRQVWVVDSTGTQTYDYGQVRGSVREERTYDGSTLRAKTLHSLRFAGPNGYDNPTATRTGSWPNSTAKAYQTVENETVTRTLLSGGVWRWTKQARDFDTYGLPIKVTDYADAGTAATADNVGTTGDDTCTTVSYTTRNIPKWMVNYPSKSLTTDCAASPADANYLSGAQLRYDSGAVGAMPTKGQLTRTDALTTVSGTTLTWQQTGRTDYDPLGRVVGEYDALDRKTTTAYTPAGVGAVTAKTVTNPLGHVTGTTFDGPRTMPVSVSDANNKITTMAYDSLGRLTKVWLPGRATSLTPNLEHTYTMRGNAANAVGTKQLARDGTQVASYELYDGRLRLRQAQNPSIGAQGGRVITDTQYDNRGLAAKQAVLWNSAAPADTLLAFDDTTVDQRSVTAFDAFGRPVQDEAWSRTTKLFQTQTQYDGDRTTVTPPTGGATVTTVDASGRDVTRDVYPTTATTGTKERTSYAYDRLGQLTTVTDAAGNQSRYGFDRLGRRVTSTDPDTGVSSATYDAAGRLTATTDARGQKISHEYDNLDRETVRWAGDITSGTKLATLTYDTLAKGMPSSSTRWIGTNQYTISVDGYNNRYQPTGQTWSIPMVQAGLAGTYSTSYGYDPVGNLTTVTYPQGGGLPAETVTHDYTALGAPTTTLGLTSYVTATSYGGLGQLSQRVNGTAGAAQLTRQYTYDPATMRLTAVKSLLPNQAQPGQFTTVQNDSYGYSATGDITRLTDGTDNQSQCYRYDGQHRLTDAWTATDACAANPTTGTGKYPYWDTFQFDAAGRRTTDTHRTTATDATTRTFTYPAAGAARTHAASSVAHTGATVRTDTMAYDTVGNTRQRTVNGMVTAFTYNSENQFGTATVHTAGGDKVTGHLYDATGGLLIRTEPTGVTLYAAGQEYKVTGGTVSATRYYTHGAATVAVRNGSGCYWLGADHQASASVTVNAANATVQRRWYTPYGSDRAVQGAWPADRGFLNKQTNTSTGLLDVGAREYDPNLGTFLSPDALTALNDPRTFNPYAYTAHSPITYSDPTGLMRDVEGGEFRPLAWTQLVPGNPSEKKRQSWVESFMNSPFTGFSKQEVETFRKRVINPYTGPDLMTWGDALVWASGDDDTWMNVCKHGGGSDADCESSPFTGNDLNDLASSELTILLVGTIGGVVVVGCVLALEACAAAASGAAIVAGEAAMSYATGTAFSTGVTGAAAMVGFRIFLGAEAKAGAAAAESVAGSAAAGCEAYPNSFVPGTAVLLADGTTKPIEEVRVGDVMLATDPLTGRTRPEPVTATIIGDGTKTLVDITIDTDGDAGDAEDHLIATGHHPFWVDNKQSWSDAETLHAGDALRTDTGRRLSVVTTRTWTQQQRVHNLAVGTTHTYYVLARDTAVLVHNCNPLAPKELDRLKGVVDMADMTAAAAIKARGGGGKQIHEIATDYQQMTLRDLAHLAVRGDAQAVKALKMVKQAGSQGKGGK